MITFFTTAKPFIGHSAIIQRNALQSWKALYPDVEVILFGDDEGAAEVCVELGLRYEPHVERNGLGLKRIDYFFDRAQEVACHEILCYVNCDIILMADFYLAAQQVSSARQRFLMVGRRWDTKVAEPIDFSVAGWADEIRSRALTESDRQCGWYIDYFAFSRGLYLGRIPPLVIGRIYWDNWLIWCASQLGAAVVDATPAVCAVHQRHDYSYHPDGRDGIWRDEYAQHNLELAGGTGHLKTIDDAAFVLGTRGRLRVNPEPRRRMRLKRKQIVQRFVGELQRVLTYVIWLPTWHFFLGLTRPLRSRLGLRSKGLQ